MYSDLIGVPFVDGGREKTSGFDCWGLVMEIYRRNGIELPDYKVACEDASRIHRTVVTQRFAWVRLEKELPDLCLVVLRFNTAVMCNHTGVYLGEGRFIHTRSKIGVNIDRIDSPAWRKRIEGFYVPRGVQP